MTERITINFHTQTGPEILRMKTVQALRIMPAMHMFRLMAEELLFPTGFHHWSDEYDFEFDKDSKPGQAWQRFWEDAVPNCSLHLDQDKDGFILITLVWNNEFPQDGENDRMDLVPRFKSILRLAAEHLNFWQAKPEPGYKHVNGIGFFIEMKNNPDRQKWIDIANEWDTKRRAGLPGFNPAQSGKSLYEIED